MSSKIFDNIANARHYLELVEKDLKGASLNDLLELDGAQQKDLLDAIKLLEDVIGKLPETKVEAEETKKIRRMEITIDIPSRGAPYKARYPQLTDEMFWLIHHGKKVEAIKEYVKAFLVITAEAKAACEQYYEAKRTALFNPWPYPSVTPAKLLD